VATSRWSVIAVLALEPARVTLTIGPPAMLNRAPSSRSSRRPASRSAWTVRVVRSVVAVIAGELVIATPVPSEPRSRQPPSVRVCAR